MRLKSLTVNNFGVFRDSQPFDLTSTPNENLILVSGHNGAGKSTLFLALQLALHGSLALGDRVSQSDYNQFLLDRLHRRTQFGKSVTAKRASLALRFEYVRSGIPIDVRIERAWSRSGKNVSEELSVTVDDQPPDVAPEDYQYWINDLVPPGLLPLCFFDGEKVETLVRPDEHSELLQDVLHRLLGLHLTERLEDDLEYYLAQHGRSRAIEQARRDVVSRQQAADEQEARLQTLVGKIEALDERIVDVNAALTKEERELAAAGGTYAARRAARKERLESVEAEIERVTHELSELCAGLLPFALAPNLCRALSRRLTHEARIRQQHMAEDVLRERVAEIERSLQDEEWWQEFDQDVPPATRRAVSDRLVQSLREVVATEANTSEGRAGGLIHHLAEPEHEQLQGWIYRALHAVPERAQRLGERLRDLRVEAENIREELQRTPDDEVLAPIHEAITELEQERDELRRRRDDLQEEKIRAELALEDAVRELERAVDRLEDARSHEHQLDLAQKSKLVLRTYQDALVNRELGRLEEELVAAFNTVCRKEHLLAAAEIDPDTFQTRLESATGHRLRLNDFSAGERQLYALAVLWAVRRISGRTLPLVIDTPLARLDQEHRRTFLHEYVPAVSDQVILFATDAEVDETLLEEARSNVSRVYRLTYHPSPEKTEVRQDTPRRATEEVALYRSDALQPTWLNVHNGYNGDVQLWTTDPARVGANGTVEKAFLPAGAKRFVLFDPSKNDFDQLNIAELERLTDTTDILSRLQNSDKAADVWHPEWMHLIQQAGYDSIVADSEEYVLTPSKLVYRNGEGARATTDGT